MMNWIAMSTSAIQLEVHMGLLAPTEERYNVDAHPMVCKSRISYLWLLHIKPQRESMPIQNRYIL